MQYKFPILQIAPARIRKVLSRIKKKIWTDLLDLDVQLSIQAGGDAAQAYNHDYKAIESGSYFSKPEWGHRWFRLSIPEAKSSEANKRYLYWNVQGEATVYIDGKVWCGLDVAHPRCPLPDTETHLYIECGLYQTGIWLKGIDEELLPVDSYGLRFNSAVLQMKNEQEWNAFHDFDVLVNLMNYHLEKEGIGLLNKGLKKGIQDCSPLLRKLIRRLDEASDVFDRGGIEAFGRACQKIYSDFPAESWGLDLAVVGNSHIDLVWMWPERITWKKAVHTFSSMLRLAERYPEMIFTISQPPLMEHIKESAPELFHAVRDKIKMGEWEATGALEVEADTLLPCGESLVRSFQTGRKSFREYFGTEGETLWLPDVFGYSQCIPQICALSGISYFFTTKMTWSELNRFPHNSFIWESPDGSSVLAHLANCGYDYALTVGQAIDNANMYRQSDVHNEVLIPFGYGDGGGGLTEVQCERVRRMNNLASAPRTRWTGTGEFFQRLDKTRHKLPVFRGEMYLEYHRGTYTTQALLKDRFRACERALQTYEAACVLFAKAPEAADQWKRLLFMQFHDALPGSSIALVYKELIPELHTMISTLKEKTQTLIDGGEDRSKMAYFNPHGVAIQRLFDVPEALWRSANPGREPLQFSEGKVIVPLSFEGCSIVHEDESPTFGELTADSRFMRNSFFRVEFDEKGQLISFIPKGQGSLLSGPCHFTIHEDHPANFDAWDLDRNACWLKDVCSLSGNAELIENGPLRARLRSSGAIGDASQIRIDYIVEAGNPSLMIEIDLHWIERETALRYEVPTVFQGRDALFGGPFGSVKRSGNIANLADAAQWEVPGSRWMAVTNDGGRGMALVTESKYGFSCNNGVAGLSLVRSPRTPDREELVFTDQGRHRIRFSLSSYSPVDGKPSPASLADVLYTDPVLCFGKSQEEPFRFDGPSTLTVSWLKPAENGACYEIRIHETGGDFGEFSLSFPKLPRDIYLSDLQGHKKELPLPAGRNAFRFPYKAHQILTVYVAI